MITIVFFIIINIFLLFYFSLIYCKTSKETFSTITNTPNVYKGNVLGWDLLPPFLEENPLFVNSGDTSWGPGYGRPWGEGCWNDKYIPSKCPYYWTGKCPYE